MKVVFDIAEGRLAIEGDGPDLIKVLEAARLLAPNISQIQIITDAEKQKKQDYVNPPGAAEASKSGSSQASSSQNTLRQFARSLSLDNASERIAAIAYYVNKIEKRQAFSPKEIDGWFTMCGFQKPGQMSVALFDAKRKYGYMENCGRGMWRISNQGENLMIAKIEDGGGK
jgi:hypothetical protein